MLDVNVIFMFPVIISLVYTWLPTLLLIWWKLTLKRISWHFSCIDNTTGERLHKDRVHMNLSRNLQWSAYYMMTSSNGNIFRVTGQWRGALIFSLICAWTNGWVNNRDTGDLRRHRARYEITVTVLDFQYGHWCFITVYLVQTNWLGV